MNDFNIFKQIKSGVPGEKKDDLIGKLDKKTIDVNKEIEAIERYSDRAIKYLKNANLNQINNIEYLSSAVDLLEKTVLLARQISCDICNEVVEKIEKIIIDNATIKIEKEANWIKIDLPLLMPKRKYNIRNTYYKAELANAVSVKKLSPEITEDIMCICFIHCYEETHFTWRKKDHDNIDVKWIIDAINNFFLIDDGPLETALFHYSTIDTHDHTLVYLVPLKDFTTFFENKILLNMNII